MAQFAIRRSSRRSGDSIETATWTPSSGRFRIAGACCESASGNRRCPEPGQGRARPAPDRSIDEQDSGRCRARGKPAGCGAVGSKECAAWDSAYLLASAAAGETRPEDNSQICLRAGAGVEERLPALLESAWPVTCHSPRPLGLSRVVSADVTISASRERLARRLPDPTATRTAARC